MLEKFASVKEEKHNGGTMTKIFSSHIARTLPQHCASNVPAVLELQCTQGIENVRSVAGQSCKKISVA